MNSVKLGVNVDHVATVRQARGVSYPDPVLAADSAERAGAEGITVHLREDRRHIQERDVEILLQTVQTKVNLEMAATESMVSRACRWRPADCCLVPEKREELTTEGGLDVVNNRDRLRDVVAQLSDAGVRVSLFIDPELDQIAAAVAVGAPVIELHTGAYANALHEQERQMMLEKLKVAVCQGQAHGLIVHAGHGLNYHNVQPVAALSDLQELNIGHAIIARALFEGMGAAVRTMCDLIRSAKQS